MPACIRLGGKCPYLLSHLVSLVIVPTSCVVFPTVKANHITKHGLTIFGSLVTLFLNLLMKRSGGSFHPCEFISVVFEHLGEIQNTLCGDHPVFCLSLLPASMVLH